MDGDALDGWDEATVRDYQGRCAVGGRTRAFQWTSQPAQSPSHSSYLAVWPAALPSPDKGRQVRREHDGMQGEGFAEKQGPVIQRSRYLSRWAMTAGYRQSCHSE